MTRLFLDTNIVVDLLDRREPFCHDAVRLFTMAYNITQPSKPRLMSLLPVMARILQHRNSL